MGFAQTAHAEAGDGYLTITRLQTSGGMCTDPLVEVNGIDLHWLTASFHAVILKTTDGFVITGRSSMPDGTSDFTTLTPITAANGFNYVGTPLIAKTGGSGYTFHTLLTDQKFYVWGASSDLYDPALGTAFTEAPLPVGVSATDIKDYSYHERTGLVFLTKSGELYVQVRDAALVSVPMMGNTTADANGYYHVLTGAGGTAFSGVDQVQLTSYGIFALKSDGTLWTWGKETYLADGTALADRNYPTQMAPLPAGVTPVQIALTRASSNLQNSVYPLSYLVLGSDGKIYSVGENSQGQLGIGNTTDQTAWQTVKTPDGTADLTNVKYISAENGSSQFVSASAILEDNSLLSWGQNSIYQIGGPGDLGAYSLPITPNGFVANGNEAIVVANGGHITPYIDKVNGLFCNVGHDQDGAFGAGGTASSSNTYECLPFPAGVEIAAVACTANDTTAENDINQTPVNVPVSGSVTTNDTDAQGDAQTVTSALADTDGDGLVDEALPIGVATTIYGTDDAGNVVPAGTITLNADGSYDYTPATDFTGTVPVAYTVTDDSANGAAADSATLTIEVTGPNASGLYPPIAQDDTNTTEQGTAVSAGVISPNDSDPDGDVSELSVTGVLMDTDGDGLADDAVAPGTTATVYGTDSAGNVVPAGTLVVNADGTYTYTPDPAFTGTVPAEYTITDADGLTDSATLTIDVAPDGGNATYTNDDANSGPQGETQTGNIQTNDNDPEGDAQTVTLIDTDGDGVPDTAPTAGAPITITDGSGNTLGALTLDPNTGGYIWAPEPDFVGTAPIAYTVEDGNGATDTATLYLTTLPTNDTTAENDINQTPVNVPVSGSVTTNDTDAQGDAQTVTSALADTDGDGLVDEALPIGVATTIYGTDDAGNVVPAGTITLNADGSYDYTPATDFTGTVPVAYTVTDDSANGAATDSATLTIEVTGPNASGLYPPIAQDDTNTTEQGTAVSAGVISPNDSDPDGDVSELSVTGVLMDTDGDGLADDAVAPGTTATVYGTDSAGNVVPAGTLVVNADGTYTYTPDPAFTGTVPAEYTITDADGLTDSATLTIDVAPDGGNATYTNDDANSGPQGETQTGNIQTNDNDPEGDAQTVTLIDTDGDGVPDTAPTAGTPITITDGSGNTLGALTLDPNTGGYIWAPEPDFVGTAPIAYTVEDGNGATDTATLYLTTLPNPSISGVVFNDADLMTNGAVDGTGIGVPAGTPLYVTLLDSLGNVVQSVPVNADGSYTFNNVAPNATYTVQLGTTDESANAGSAPSTGASLPAGWINTGENCCSGLGSDGSTNGLLAVSVGMTDVTNSDFGIVNSATLGVTISYVTSERRGDAVLLIWQTSAEFGLAGFNIRDESVQLNGELIPSKVIDSLEVTDYSVMLVTDAEGFFIEKVSVNGNVERMGPYQVGESYGEPHTLDSGVAGGQLIYLPLIQE
ncbi:MAG: tandem-95 repeat protein [Caldilineaceae bacterium]|nr:tandem-95 repeat protein [Caldilineaceae bacterium]